MFRITRGKTGRHRVFLRLLAPNVLFLLFPLLVGWIVYQKTLHVVEKEVTAGNMSLLMQTRDMLDQRFAEIGSIARQFAKDTRIQQFQHVTDPFEGSNLYRVLCKPFITTGNNRDISKLLSGLDLSGGGQAYILNEDGTMLSSAASGGAVPGSGSFRLSGSQGSMMREVGSRQMMVTYANSNYNGWTYLVVQPADVVLEKVYYIKKITFSMAFLFLLLGVLIGGQRRGRTHTALSATRFPA